MRIDLGTKFRELIADLGYNYKPNLWDLRARIWKVEIWF